MEINVEFSGGLELMFDKKKNIQLSFEPKTGDDGADVPYKLQDVIESLRVDHLKEKEEMFYLQGTVRPGIIVLVNDTDWELLDAEEYLLQPKDTVSFISTLHGG
jgi:ubiquitin related modifier 1